MKVIAALNGSISSETTAFYALKYAKAQNFTLVLFHAKNKKDDIESVEASIERIKIIAGSEHVTSEMLILDIFERENIKETLHNLNIDTIFCSTRKEKRFISDSFSKMLIDMKLDADIAVVRVVDIANTTENGNIILSIKEDRLSVKKFTFFSTLASNGSKGEIYSVTPISRFKLASLDIHSIRKRLQSINYNLRHYKKLSTFMPFTIHIKHDFTPNETKSILSEVAKNDVQLLIVGAKRLSSVTSYFSKEIPIEKLMRETSVNTIAYYTKG